MSDDVAYGETFGPEHVRPVPAVCPDCPCCTVQLCERGRSSLLRCRGHVPDGPQQQVVKDCPCSAEERPGTLTWHAARYRAVQRAEEQPLPQDVEAVLRDVQAGVSVYQRAELLGQLTGGGLVRFEECRPVVTEFGRLYLAARVEERRASHIVVTEVDRGRRMASVIVVGWRDGEVVPLPLDLLVLGTGLQPEELVHKVVQGYANCGAASVDDLVVTRVSGEAWTPPVPATPVTPVTPIMPVAPILPAGPVDGDGAR